MPRRFSKSYSSWNELEDDVSGIETGEFTKEMHGGRITADATKSVGYEETPTYDFVS